MSSHTSHSSVLKIVLNYVISVITFIFCAGILLSIGVFLGDIGGLVAFTLSAMLAGLTGGFVTRQYVSLKVLFSIIGGIFGIGLIIVLLVVLSEESYDMFGLAMFFVVILFFTVLLFLVFSFHAIFAYFGVKLREKMSVKKNNHVIRQKHKNFR